MSHSFLPQYISVCTLPSIDSFIFFTILIEALLLNTINAYAYVLSGLYFYADCDITFVCGDVNSRLSNMNDNI